MRADSKRNNHHFMLSDPQSLSAVYSVITFFSFKKMASRLSGQILRWRMVTCQYYCFKNTELGNSAWALV